MVVRVGLACHVGVVTGGKIDPLDQAEIDQQVERPEDGGAGHGAAAQA